MVSITILILVVSFSYAYIKLNKEEKETNLLGTDCIKLEMEDESEAIELHHAYPLTDKAGQESTPYKFKLTNQCGVGVGYEVRLRIEEVEEGQNKIQASNIAASVDGNNKVVLKTPVTTPTEVGKEEYKINNDNLTLNPYEEVEHEVRVWLDKDAGNETQNGTFKSKVVIEATQNQTAIYTDPILHGADPVLYDTKEETGILQTASEVEVTTNDTLVPIKISENDGTVTKADVTKEWYNYEKKEWANAVILVDNEKAKTLKAGDPIQENEIESYFVWIPKYRYKLFDMGNYNNLSDNIEENAVQPIEIEFGLKDTIDDTTNENYKQCQTPGTSGGSGTCKEGYWMTHPAFLAFEDSKGFWAGKFETGYNQSFAENSKTIKVTDSWSKNGAQKDTNNESNKVIIKPNIYSWRNISVGNAYKTSYNYERKLDSHMMKNTEWGAVAYLSHSIYGTCIGESCTEVRINNNLGSVTGYAAVQEPSTGFTNTLENGNIYETPNGGLGTDGTNTINYKNKASNVASTTGNFSGIYDMSGGAWEYVMGAVTSVATAAEVSLENVQLGLSSLTKDDIKDKKYIDLYLTGTITQYDRRILGDATGEMGPFSQKQYSSQTMSISSWYSDGAMFIRDGTWFARSGFVTHGINSGMFDFAINGGSGDYDFNGFRIVLTPTNEAM